MTIKTIGATSAPSCTRSIQVARIAEVGVSPSLAMALADLYFPSTRRDDLVTLVAVTASRCAAAGVGVRS